MIYARNWVARHLIHFGIWIMPDGRYKKELLKVLWELYDKIQIEVNGSHLKVIINNPPPETKP